MSADSKFEPQRKETNLLICAPSEDSDQPAHLRSFNGIFIGRFLDNLDAWNLHTYNGDSLQTVRMRRVICVFVGRRCQEINLLTSAPSEDSDQPAHSRSLIGIFTGRFLDSP